MVYIIGWAGMLLSSFIVQYKVGRYFVYALLIYLTFISFFRGDVGTDTATYISIFNSMASGGSSKFEEIGFIFLSKILLLVSPNASFAVKIISVIFFVMLGLYFYRADENEAFLFVSYILPVFAYSYSMNGLRIGVAFASILLISQYISKTERWEKGLKYFLIPPLFHVSTITFPFFLFLYRARFTSLRALLSILFMTIAALFFFFLVYEYLFSKLSLYSGYKSPSIFSGARVYFPLLVVLFGCFIGGLPVAEKLRIVSVSIVLIFLAIGMAQVSYAGLRVLDLLAFIVPLSILNSYKKSEGGFGWNMKNSFLIAGFLNMIATYSGYLNELGQGESPFLPYTLFF